MNAAYQSVMVVSKNSMCDCELQTELATFSTDHFYLKGLTKCDWLFML